jgi:peptidoglycan hydrolase-like protein with peptidoglycan-binding domain
MAVNKTGAGVRALQARLKARGWKITVDGEFGPQTDRIVRAFQKDKGLTVDGEVGPKTWSALWTTAIT